MRFAFYLVAFFAISATSYAEILTYEFSGLIDGVSRIPGVNVGDPFTRFNDDGP